MPTGICTRKSLCVLCEVSGMSILVGLLTEIISADSVKARPTSPMLTNQARDRLCASGSSLRMALIKRRPSSLRVDLVRPRRPGVVGIGYRSRS